MSNQTCHPLQNRLDPSQPAAEDWLTQAQLDRQTNPPPTRLQAAAHWRRQYAIRRPTLSELEALEALIRHHAEKAPRGWTDRAAWERSMETGDRLEGQRDALRASLRSTGSGLPGVRG